MKARILPLSVLIMLLTLVFAACQKNSADDNTDYSTQSTVHSDDQNRFSGEVDAVANDADLTLETTAGFAGRGEQVQSLICDATIVVDTMSNPRTITITYNGTNCLGNRTRTGVVVISMAHNVRWHQPGATLNVSFQNFKVTRVIDNKSITLNGTQTYTNVSGGLLIHLASLQHITHRITSSNMSVTFDNGAQRNWQVAKQRVFNYNNGIVINSTGTHTEGNVTGVAEWGTNRFGNSFTTAITHPLVVRQDCNFRLTSGKLEHATTHFNAAVTFGLDANGNPTGCPGLGVYYFKLVWSGILGIPHTVILPY